MDDDGGTASVGPSPIQSGTDTNTASVGCTCTEGGGGRLVCVDNPSFCSCSGCGSEVVIWGDSLLVGVNTALVARPYGWCEWDRGSPIVSDGGTNCGKKRLFLNDRCPKSHTLTQYWSKLPSSTTVPDLSHLLGCEPRSFYRNTLSPSDRGASGRVCTSRVSIERGILVRMASSFWEHGSRHVGRIDGLLYLMHRLMKG